MKVGDIIRRKASDGAPIGPYMKIQVIKDDRVYADVNSRRPKSYMI